MIDSQPDLAPLIRRVRGGYLKIQGTWMPYEVSHCCCHHRNPTPKIVTDDIVFYQVALKLSRRFVQFIHHIK